MPPKVSAVYADEPGGPISIWSTKPQSEHRWVLHPRDSKFRRAWDLVTGLAVIWSSFMVPFQLSFTWWEGSVGWDALSVALDIYFVLDVVLNFRTGYIVHGEVEMSPKRIARHYARTWFVVDALASLPLELLGGGKSSTKSLKIVKLQKLPKLLRLGRIVRFLKQYAKYYALFASLFLLAVLVHFSSCVWVALLDPCKPNADGDERFAFVSYVDDRVAYELCVNSLTATVPGVGGLYVRALQVALSLMLGISTFVLVDDRDLLSPAYVGYPHYDEDVVMFSNFLLVIGSVMVALLFANVFVLVSSRNSSEANFRIKVDRIKDEMQRHEVPAALTERVLRYYEYVWANRIALDQSALLTDPHMSRALQQQLVLHINRDLLREVSLLQGCDDDVLARVCLALRLQIYLPKDMIIREHQWASEMYVLVRGVVEVFSHTNRYATSIELRDGACFGEIALLQQVRRTRNVQALTMCEVRLLSREDFEDAMRDFPEFERSMQTIASERALRDNALFAESLDAPQEEPRSWTPMDGRWATPAQAAQQGQGPPPLSSGGMTLRKAMSQPSSMSLPSTAEHDSRSPTPSPRVAPSQLQELRQAVRASTSRMSSLERDVAGMKTQMELIQTGIGTLLARSSAV